MGEIRQQYHEELESLEQTLMEVAARAEQMVGMAVTAIVTQDPSLADQVIALDNEIDAIYHEVHDRWVNVVARQQPMAGDLRLLAALLQLNVTLERMGDQCVNISKLAKLSMGLPRNERILAELQEMADLVRPMVRTAVQSFVRRDPDEARLLPAMDEPIDRLNRNMYREVVECGGDREMLEWATRMMMVARALERIGDQAVDIGEQAAFLTTGEFQEFDEEGLKAGDDRQR